MALSILFETVTDKKEESIIKQRVNTKIKVTLLIQCIHWSKEEGKDQE